MRAIITSLATVLATILFLTGAAMAQDQPPAPAAPEPRYSSAPD